ncbi:uncharacterized protein LOC131638422 [Vicia villosa]|uniref:uncharacterized protein LOC131638422 n=1 Tax=Vicia villosa TaxID=3911 RepID=UPI00273AE4D3|nr:uncharacterized protein LOC131638422 [Vicia villosa]
MSYSTLIQTHTPNNNEGEDKDFCFWTSPSSESSRIKDILEGKKELMEMMQHMPESSFELSFQDMVVEQHQVPEAKPKPEPEQVSSKVQQPQHKKLNEKKKTKKKENKCNSRHGKILRAESMDSETFLLKMVFPTSLDWKKKTTKKQNGSKVEEKDKEWRIKRFFTEHRQNTRSSSSSSNSGCDGNDKSRYVDRSFSFSQGCFPFFDHRKSKLKKDTLKL